MYSLQILKIHQHIRLQVLYTESKRLDVLVNNFDKQFIELIRQKHSNGEVLSIFADWITGYVFGGNDVLVAAKQIGIKRAKIYLVYVMPSSHRLYEMFLCVMRGRIKIKQYELVAKIVKDLRIQDRDVVRFDDEVLMDWVWLKANEYFEQDELMERTIKINRQSIAIKPMKIKEKLRKLKSCNIRYVKQIFWGYIKGEASGVLVNGFNSNVIIGQKVLDAFSFLGIKHVKGKSIRILSEKERTYKAFLEEVPGDLTDRTCELLVGIVNSFPYDEIKAFLLNDEEFQESVRVYINIILEEGNNFKGGSHGDKKNINKQN